MKKQNIKSQVKKAISKDLESLKFYRGKISRAPSAKTLSFEEFQKNEKAQKAYSDFERSRAAAAAELGTKAAQTPIQKIIQRRAKDGVFIDKDANKLFEGLKLPEYQKVEAVDLTSGVHFFVNEELRGILDGMEENGDFLTGYVIENMPDSSGTIYVDERQDFFDIINKLQGSDKTLDITIEKDLVTGAQVLRSVLRYTPPTGKGTGRKKK